MEYRCSEHDPTPKLGLFCGGPASGRGRESRIWKGGRRTARRPPSWSSTAGSRGSGFGRPPLFEKRRMRILPNVRGIMVAALAGTAAIVAFAQSPPVLTGAAAYGDWHSDAPGVRRRITPADMPPPYETASASRYPTVVARPADAWPKAPPGFVIELLAGGLDNPRLIRVSPSGDIFVAESGAGRIRVLHVTHGAKTPEIRVFVE